MLSKQCAQSEEETRWALCEHSWDLLPHAGSRSAIVCVVRSIKFSVNTLDEICFAVDMTKSLNWCNNNLVLVSWVGEVGEGDVEEMISSQWPGMFEIEFRIHFLSSLWGFINKNGNGNEDVLGYDLMPVLGKTRWTFESSLHDLRIFLLIKFKSCRFTLKMEIEDFATWWHCQKFHDAMIWRFHSRIHFIRADVVTGLNDDDDEIKSTSLAIPKILQLPSCNVPSNPSYIHFSSMAGEENFSNPKNLRAQGNLDEKFRNWSN
jgi:hypothetical protein